MTRNQIIREVGRLLDHARDAACRNPAAHAKVLLFQEFCNDLCNAPTARNRRLGSRTYTLKEAARTLVAFAKETSKI
jgi:hypothetical protein